MTDTALLDRLPKRERRVVEAALAGSLDVETFVDAFSIIAEAEAGPKVLRALVLSLATRGRLVPETSRAERPEAPREVAGAPFVIPSTWRWMTVADVCSYVQRGKSPTYVDRSDVPVVSQKCVQWTGFDLQRARFIDQATLADYAAERFLRDGDLLWNSTGHGTVGRVALFRSDVRYKKVVCDSHVTVLRPTINAQYL